MKIFILDVYNILYRCKEFNKLINKSFDFAVFSLLENIKSYSIIHPKFKFHFVIDGYIEGLKSNYTNIIISQSHKNLNADSIIRKIIKSLHSYKETYIVSNDNELINYAKLHTIKHIDPHEFCQMISSHHRNIDEKQQNHPEQDKPQKVESSELEFYKQLFNNPLDDSELTK